MLSLLYATASRNSTPQLYDNEEIKDAMYGPIMQTMMSGRNGVSHHGGLVFRFADLHAELLYCKEALSARGRKSGESKEWSFLPLLLSTVVSSKEQTSMAVIDSAALNWEALLQEAKRHLQQLLRFDTTNPPGNEELAAAYIREQLVAEGIEPRLIEPAPGRVSVWACLPGSGIARPLLLVSHTDVVPVERD